ncbi:MAG: stress response translation initiation inhibitor YciH [Methanobrevibacter sp.]|jgi:translation initiation factor 1|nr:stress response translation initiation inhibitor YciH [Candidatus Methanovirga meridionalis]
MKICDVCGLPEELCVCQEIAREVQTVKIFTVRRRFGKLMTIVEGIDEQDIDIKDLTKELKARCACGGTAKKGQIELQGDHKNKVKSVLSDMGFSSDTIEIKESRKFNKRRNKRRN